MTLGFTGTKKGLTRAQEDSLRQLFVSMPLRILHHGDCIGGDEKAHEIAFWLKAHIVIHPPREGKLRAYCARADEWMVHLSGHR